MNAVIATRFAFFPQIVFGLFVLAIPATILVLIIRSIIELMGERPAQDHRPVFTDGTVLAIIIVMICEFILILPRGGGRDRSVFHAARVQSEMESFKASITQFKVRFGTNPPSGLTLYESSDGWRADDGQSRRLMKQLWPQFNFSLDRDINNDGDFEDTIKLSGAECLVFFLGGIQSTIRAENEPAAVKTRLTGFSKNPAAPFSVGGLRDGPFFEFDPKRRSDDYKRFTDIDGDGFLEYRSPLFNTEAPYIYLSSYGGAGYRPTDFVIYPPDDAGNPRNLYYKDKNFKVPYNSDSFQIICAGRDDRFGPGGHFEPEAIDDLFVGERKFEHDNITNFHTGPLGNTSEKKNWLGFNMMSVCLLLGVGFILLLIRSLRRSRSCLKSESA